MVRARLIVSVLVVAIASACGSGTRLRTVPWANRPLPLYRVPNAKLVRYSTSAPPCRASRLRVRRGRTGVGLGNELQELVFTNVGRHACLLRGRPVITAETRGRRRTLHPETGGTYFGSLVPADIRPGGRVFLDVATSRGCDGGVRRPVPYRGLRFVLPRGGTVRSSVAIDVYCGLSISDFGLPEHYVEPQAAPGTPGALNVRVRLPPTARPGATVRFTVVLGNPTDRKVDLRPCPGYTETFVPSRGTVRRRSYALNCDAVHDIPAHTRVRYAMRLDVPRGASTGIAKLAWNLDTPTGPFAGGVILVAAG